MNTAPSLPMKDRFDLPDGIRYLDGNSLGPMPRGTQERVEEVMRDEWARNLIKAWNDNHWMDLPSRVGARVARLIGAPEGSVTMGDTLSIKLFQALSAGLKLRPGRRVILTDSGNFPSDLYVAQGLIRQLDRDHELRIVAPEEVAGALDEDVAVAMITQVDYRTGRLHDMEEITGAAHAAGAVMLWDLAHSAGAVPVDLAGSNCEFAVGCTYKYLNGGPGAPAFIYARDEIAEVMEPALAGWMGHSEPFAFVRDYDPAPGIERMRVGTPPVLQLAALEQALTVWEGVEMSAIREASIRLSELFIAEVEARCPDLTLASPRDPDRRGSQVSFAFEHGYPAMQALIDRGVIGDFRAPDIMRFGFTPLYLDEEDIRAAAAILGEILGTRAWDDPKYHRRGRVT
ncbi:kynureninase [Palleronia sp. LCG004]|uniref:kynureninase n=1 Tax=Palleronia sp. LCG004 TaxID=3079304 RepID=UPI00294260A0|nr:kynureninase [Palleronia sp. LCG004]WOI58216.1 kynureninase [Palleronia sp. LCG004]